MRVAVIQLNSQEDVRQNLASVRQLVGQAASAGAKLVTLPENFAFMGEEAQKRELAERLDGAFPGPIVGTLAELGGEARRLGPRRRHARGERRPRAALTTRPSWSTRKGTSRPRTARCTSST